MLSVRYPDALHLHLPLVKSLQKTIMFVHLLASARKGLALADPVGSENPTFFCETLSPEPLNF